MVQRERLAVIESVQRPVQQGWIRNTQGGASHRVVADTREQWLEWRLPQQLAAKAHAFAAGLHLPAVAQQDVHVALTAVFDDDRAAFDGYPGPRRSAGEHRREAHIIAGPPPQQK